MKILAINGSHRPGKGTALLLRDALDAASSRGAETELVELAQLDIAYCTGCNRCLSRTTCAISDDMDELYEKLVSVDGIIVGSPDYFSNVSARMKTFFDRTRPLHMVENVLKGKVGGMVATGGLNGCGLEETLAVMDRFLATHEMLIVHPRVAGPVVAGGVMASQFAGIDDDGNVRWRNIQDDQVARSFARQLSCDMVDLIERTA